MPKEFRPFDTELGNPRLEEAPVLKAAVERGEELVEKGRLNEAIRILDELDDEISKMELGAHFSRIRKISENVLRGTELLPQYEGMTEAEFKKAQLHMQVSSLKGAVMGSISHIKDLVLDIESSKAHPSEGEDFKD